MQTDTDEIRLMAENDGEAYRRHSPGAAVDRAMKEFRRICGRAPVVPEKHAIACYLDTRWSQVAGRPEATRVEYAVTGYGRTPGAIGKYAPFFERFVCHPEAFVEYLYSLVDPCPGMPGFPNGGIPTVKARIYGSGEPWVDVGTPWDRTDARFLTWYV